ncbi:hypothetical protein GCM10010145_09800 [Streptomyces ruber]|uniref:Uncharacterized protein n=2 Tax=Streptomyces TaxID=1883 RepID=A0A918ENI5_9ACTN|nr:hypothetical protein GCM10010145_09800 [Streptomyces ruber]
MFSSFSDVHLLARPPLRGGSAGQGWEKCYVPGKKSARTRRREPRPNHRRSPPSDNHWSRLTHITHNLPDRLCHGAETPLSEEPAPLPPSLPGGEPENPLTRLAGGVRDIGPSVADRGAFSPTPQGGSLLSSNGQITGR